MPLPGGVAENFINILPSLVLKMAPFHRINHSKHHRMLTNRSWQTCDHLLLSSALRTFAQSCRSPESAQIIILCWQRELKKFECNGLCRLLLMRSCLRKQCLSMATLSTGMFQGQGPSTHSPQACLTIMYSSHNFRASVLGRDHLLPRISQWTASWAESSILNPGARCFATFS